MPGQNRNRAPNLPDIDEAVAPFSSFFAANNFDPAIVESTAQLADDSVFISPTGQRYLIRKLPDSASHATGTALASRPPEVQALNATSANRKPLPVSTKTAPVASLALPDVIDISRRSSNADSKLSADEVAELVGNLQLGRFGASALYELSDGGVQAAETLTDSNPAPGPVFREPVFSDTGSVGDGNQCQTTATSSRSYSEGCYFQYDGAILSPGDTTHFSPTNFYYGQNSSGYMRTGSLPASATYQNHSSYQSSTSRGESSQDAYPQDQPRQSGSTSSGFLPEAWIRQAAGRQSAPVTTAPVRASLPSLMEYSSPVISPPLDSSPQSMAYANPVAVSPGSYAAYGYHTTTDYPAYDANPIDTQTPVVVHVHAPSTSNQSRSDGSSTTRDNVLPGEEMVYEGNIKSSPGLAGPFADAQLKVFRNNLNRDLRFYCKVGNDSETYWLKGNKAQLIPMYAYDQRSERLVYLRDDEKRKNSGHHHSSQPSNGPRGVYEFPHLQDLFRFQSKLTGEDVVLDISSVKWINLCKANSRSSKMYSSVRLQIWHEPRSRRTMQSDVASFVTAGTTVSGPLRDRTVINTSRLVVFLGRAEEYITVFITDDIDVEQKDQTCVKLKPRKYSGLHRRASRPGVKDVRAAQLEGRTHSEPVGLAIHGETYNPDVEETFSSYKTFEIEFESSPSQVNFLQAWREVLDERRKQRKRLERIQDDMKKEVFSSRDALSVRT
ncbi:uncharacterized protein E0L32_007215 [Thyridium curvatum]|uniref:Uncharacterized protein n=1 Tax=Thyridium curvatum TaxID=1093900 RepID=A0A507B642_9PEZI|nr:uncharacterized protein E0L32_007215 [Thyridium curvatum]TPX12100.1 hypothetical protein E0L32_007215 [Thyridium curvatum]